MFAILASLISHLKNLSRENGAVMSKFKHTFNIPFPNILHKVLDTELIDKFDEIFVIGDVHGCFDEMQNIIRLAHEDEYTNSKILKIFVGDLVNKGPKSKEVIDFMMRHKHDCLSVRGNHDEVVLREYFKCKQNDEQLESKNAWIANLNEDEINYLVDLPYTISIPNLSVTMVHAGLIPGIGLEETNPLDMVTMRNLICDSSRDTRELKAIKDESQGEPWALFWRGPQHVYFGHDAKRMLQKYEFATGLDTGCVYGKMLTGVFIKGKRLNQFVQVNAEKIYQTPGAMNNNS